MKKLYEESSIQAIADAIREKNGSSNTYTVSEMPTAIQAISSSSGSNDTIVLSEIPSYVKGGVLELAKKVDAVRSDSSIVFLTLSDPHIATDESTGWKANIQTGVLDACRAVKALCGVIPFDFALFLGDLTFGYKTTTKAQFVAQCKEFHSWFDEASNGLPQLWTMGNHDTGEYLAAESGSASDLYGISLLKQYFSDYNDGATYGDSSVGYCYRDFTSKKIRVISLNTVEGEITNGESATYSLSNTQLLWFAQTLYSLGSKSDATSWGFIIFGHYPLDWGYVRSAGDILNAYLNGSSITVNGTTINYSGANGATCYANFHGHLHNYKTSKIYIVPSNVSSSNPPTTQMKAWRIGVPGANYYRTNEVGENNRLDSNQIEYGDDDTPAKTTGVQDTAFCVNVINPSEKLIYSFHYGAGYDRTLSYDFNVVMYSISSTLTHCSINNPTTAIESGESYSATLTLDSGYTFDSVSVTMGGSDITSSAYSDGNITISKVTGNVVITAAASKQVNYTNLVPKAINSDGSSLPYQDGYSISSSGAASAYGSSYTITGFIPISGGSTAHTYRIAGDGISFSKTEEYNRVAWYDSNFALLKTVIPAKRFDASIYFPSTTEESTTAMTFVVTSAVTNVPTSAAYFRIGASGSGANLIVTIDEEID